MPLNRRKGDMFPFVTHTITPMCGKCNHNCKYCYVEYLKKLYRLMMRKYSGDPGIHESPSGKTDLINYYNDMNWHNGIGEECSDCGEVQRKGHLIDEVTHEKIDPVVMCKCGHKAWQYNFIFMVDCGDLFASNVPDYVIRKILAHCCKYPKNTYLFLSKNPERMLNYTHLFPPNVILGTTIETNLWRITNEVSDAPKPYKRADAIWALKQMGFRVMISVEPVMIFTHQLKDWIVGIEPEFIAVGADSQNSRLEEPTASEIENLIGDVEAAGIKVYQKPNLSNIYGWA